MTTIVTILTCVNLFMLLTLSILFHETKKIINKKHPNILSELDHDPLLPWLEKHYNANPEDISMLVSVRNKHGIYNNTLIRPDKDVWQLMNLALQTQAKSE